MSGFNKLTIHTTTSDGHNFILTEPDWTFTRPNGEVILIPVGATTDGASTPRALWRVIPPFGSYWLAAVLHDHLYRDTQQPKAECDTILLEAMESLGVDRVTREAIYEGVHLGGESAFDADRQPKAAALLVAKGLLCP